MTMRKAPAMFVLAVVLAIVGGCTNPIKFQLYSTDTDSTLITVDSTNAAQQAVGTSGATVPQWSLDRDPVSGDLFGVWYSKPDLAQINPATGATTAAATLSVAVRAIAFAPSGQLYGLVFPRTLGTINKTSGLFTVIGDIPGGDSISSIAFSSEGTLFAATYALSPFAQYLVTVDPASAAVLTSVKTGDYDITDLDYAPDDFIYATNGSPSLTRINPGTGEQTLVGTGGKVIFGIASIQEP
jgi:hypothetical protein